MSVAYSVYTHSLGEARMSAENCWNKCLEEINTAVEKEVLGLGVEGVLHKFGKISDGGTVEIHLSNGGVKPKTGKWCCTLDKNDVHVCGHGVNLLDAVGHCLYWYDDYVSRRSI